MTLSPQAQLAAMTRQRIFLAIRELLREGWLDSLTTQNIAARAGVSVQSLYRHFDSRDNLIASALDALQLVDAPFPAPPQQLSLADILSSLNAYYEMHGPAMLKLKCQASRQAQLSLQWRQFQEQHRAWVQTNFQVFLEALYPLRRQELEDQLICLTSVEFWGVYHLDLGRSQVELLEGWQRILRALLQAYR